MGTRLKNVIPSIINPNQTGFIKGRFIGENIRFILDLIDYCDTNDIPGFLMLLDFEKAFDRLEWDFIYKCLSFFKFNSGFISWIRTFYSNSSACVINNGFSSQSFAISRGVRQGCPLSPYIFTICAEVLSILINHSQLIKGINIFEIEARIIQYADDTCIFLDGSVESLNATIDILHKFEIASGLKVNYEKSNIFPLGPFSRNKPNFLK